MLDLLNLLVEFLRGTLDSPWLWLVIFLVSGLDALLPFMPSESTVVTLAVLVGPDVPRLALLTMTAALGALAGDCLGHLLGRAAGPCALRLLGKGERGRRRFEWARRTVHRNAATLIIAGRYVPGGRVAVGVTTGSLRFPAGRFAALDAIGAGIWASYCAAIGYLGWAGFSDRPLLGLLLAFGIGLAVLLVVTGIRKIALRRGAREVPAGAGNALHRPAGGSGLGRAGRPGTDLPEMDGAAAARAPRASALPRRIGDRGSQWSEPRAG